MTISPSYHIALPCITLQTPHFTPACLAAHALHLSLDEIRGRSDACNPTLTDMYQRVGCRRVPTGFGSNSSSASDADSATSSASGEYIEWAIATSQLMRALAPLAHPVPTSYRVRRVSIPLPPPSTGRPMPQRSSISLAELMPPPTLSQAASAAFARGDVDGAKLLWQQLLQVQARCQRHLVSFVFRTRCLRVARLACTLTSCALISLPCSRSRPQRVWSGLKRCRHWQCLATASEWLPAVAISAH